MRLCFFSQSLYTLGGLQKAVTEIINSIVGHDVDVTVVMSKSGKDAPCFSLDERVNVVEIGEVFSLRFSPLYKVLNVVNRRTAILDNAIGTAISERYYLRRNEREKLIRWINGEQFDVVIGVGDKFSMVIAMIADEIQARTMGWMHSTFTGYYEKRGQNLYGLKNLNQKLLGKLDMLCVLTQRDKERFDREMHTNAVVLYDPIFRADTGSRPKEADLLFVGRISRHVKGIDYLLKIMAKVVIEKPDCKLVIVGNGPDEKYLQRTAERLGLADHIQFVGFQRDVEAYYEKARILVSTSRWEGFGMSIAEAMMHGVPCVAFENDGPCEIIHDGVDGVLIRKYETDAFAEAIASLLANKEQYQKMAESAQKRAMDFELPQISAQFVTLLQTME